ncbi:MAG TPA: VOC family protein [Thermomicrobiales bacterium]|jgi:PhnB protein|nr:VOC family protein [Thermomicrobiales bacterium]
MSVTVTPHLNFRGDARAALEFYQSVVGGEIAIITYEQMGTVQDADEANQVVWGQVTGANGYRVMAYDVPGSQPFERGTQSFFVSLRGTDADEIAALWSRLADGANVIVTLAPSQWAPLYGMLIDRFGVTWVLDVEVQWSPS